MRQTKIQISPAMREFNEAVEHADFLTDYIFDTYDAQDLLIKLGNQKCYPESCRVLRDAIAGIAVSVKR